MLSSKGRATALASLLVLSLASRAPAADVAFYSSTHQDDVLSSTGHFTSNISLTAIEFGALSAYDVLVLGHVDPNDWSQEGCDKLQAFLLAGGGLVTEWNGATLLFDQLVPGTFWPITERCNFFSGRIEDVSAPEGTPLDTAGNGHPLTVGLPAELDLQAGSEFFYGVTGLGSSWSVAATFTALGATRPAVMRSAYGNGCVVVGVTDYFDALPGLDHAETLIDNMIDVSMSCSQAGAPLLLFGDSFESGSTDDWSGSSDS